MKKVGDFIKWLEGYLDALSQHDDTSVVEISDTIKTKLDGFKKSIDMDDVALDDFRKIIDKHVDDYLTKKNNREIPKDYTSQPMPSMVPYHTTCGCSVCHCVMGNTMVPNLYHYGSGGRYTTTTTTTAGTGVDKTHPRDLLKG